MDYQDFVIRLESTSQGWRARVIDSPQGEGHESLDLTLDLDTWLQLWFAQARSIRESHPQDRCSDPMHGPCLERLPSLLFETLFPGDVRRLWDRSVGAAAPGGLRLQLRFDADERALAPLLPLPWELAQDPLTRTFHGPSILTPMLRYLEVPQAHPAGELPQPLRILLVAAEPSGVPNLAVSKEASAIERAFEMEASVHIQRLSRVSLAALTSALSQSSAGFHIVHFMGHGEFDSVSGDGYLLFETRDRRPHRVNGRELTELLQPFTPHLRLAVLNACHSGSQRGAPHRDPFAGVAAALVRGGLPAVVAMQLAISDAAAVEFARTFYQQLAAGQPVEVATAAGRSAIRQREPRSFEWAIPALFSRLREGRLFDPPRSRVPAGERLRELLHQDWDESDEEALHSQLRELVRDSPEEQWLPIWVHALAHGPGRAARRAARVHQQLDEPVVRIVELLPGARRWDRAPWPIEEALYAVARHDPVLLPHARRSLGRTLQREPTLRQRLLRQAAWRRVAIAVYGGLADPRQRKASGREGHLDPRLFHHEVPVLTPHILELLGIDAAPRALLERLARAERRPEEDVDREDLVLARLALGEPLSAAQAKRHQRALRRLADTLARRGPTTRDWLEFLRTEYPVNLDSVLPQLPDCPGLSRALLALALGRADGRAERPNRSWLVRLLRHLRRREDAMALYHLAVILDTRGARLAACPDTLARAVAQAYGGASTHSTTLASASFSELGQALDGLASLPEAFDFFQGWLLVAMTPRLQANGLLPEALLMATRLSDRLNARQDTLRRLLEAIDLHLLGQSCESWLQHPRPHLALRPLADTLATQQRERFLQRLATPTRAREASSDDSSKRATLLASNIDQTWPALTVVVVRSLALDALDTRASISPSQPERPHSLQAVSAIGTAALHRLARQWLQHRDDAPQAALWSRRRFEGIEHDDADALEAWATLAGSANSPEAEEALVILGNVQALRNNLAGIFRQLLVDGTAPVRRALLRSLTYLLARRRLHARAWREIAPALPSLADDGVMDDQNFVVDGPGAVVAAVGAVRQRLAVPGAVPSPVEAAQTAYDRWRRPWPAALREPPPTLRRTLTAIGQEWLVSRAARQEVDRAARRVALEPAVFTVLLDWASQEMRRDVRQRNPDDYLLGDLLSVIAGAAERLTEPYLAHLEQLPLWERQLCEAVQDSDWSPTRRAALELLALLPQPSQRVLDVLDRAREDVEEVREVLERFEDAYRTSKCSP